MHPQRGYEVIQQLPSLQEELAVIRHHHERLDGGGYPDGLRGEAIPLEARIVAVADVYDALTTNRAYRSAYTVPDAINLLRSERGTQLDPACVDCLVELIAQSGTERSLQGALPPAVQSA